MNHITQKEKDETAKRITGLYMYQIREGVSAREWFKAKFGQQSYCWNGEHRYWIWELDKKLRVYASNVQGWTLEAHVGLTGQEVLVELRKLDARMRDRNQDSSV